MGLEETVTVTVLLAENHEELLDFLRRALEKKGYVVLTARSGLEAEAKVNAELMRGEPVNALILNLYLSRVNQEPTGVDVHTAIKKMYDSAGKPCPPAVFITSIPYGAAYELAIGTGPVLEKSDKGFCTNLLSAVDTAVEQYRQLTANTK